MWVARIDEAIAAAEQQEREKQQGERARPPTPDWIVELGIGVGIRACIHCRPDTELGVL
jgi:hypothetical protein